MTDRSAAALALEDRSVPLFATEPNQDAATWLPEIEAAALELGRPLLPWQRKAAALVAELRPDGIPRYNRILVTLPRQQGKSTLAQAVTTARARRAPAQRLYGTAQTRVDASRHLELLGVALNGRAKVRLGVGAERITFRNGSMYEIISPTKAGGHGMTIDFMNVDEVWAVEPHVMGGVIPAMAARPESQLLAISTMGTFESEVLNDMVRAGREAVADPDTRMAYIEYAAPTDEAVFDSSRWHEWMPALTRTVSYESIQAALDVLSPAEFTRAFGNRLTATLHTLFPAEWVVEAWRIVVPALEMVVAVDVNDEPAGGAIATGYIGVDDTPAAQVAEWRLGSPRWIPDTVQAMITTRQVQAVVGDFGGPARIIHAELAALCDRYYVPLLNRIPRDLGADTANFYDRLRDRKVALARSPQLEDAITGAVRKDLGNLWVINRRRTRVDVAPLIAVIMALGVAGELAVAPRILPSIV